MRGRRRGVLAERINEVGSCRAFFPYNNRRREVFTESLFWRTSNVFSARGVATIVVLCSALLCSALPRAHSLQLQPLLLLPLSVRPKKVTSLVHLWQSLSPTTQVLSLPCRRGLTPIQHCIEAGKESALRDLLRGIAKDSLRNGGGGGEEVRTHSSLPGIRVLYSAACLHMLLRVPFVGRFPAYCCWKKNYPGVLFISLRNAQTGQ